MQIDFTKKILIFCDGACSGNPGPGGFGGIIVYPEGKIQEVGGSHPKTTNNRMELAGAIQSLQKIKSRKEDVWVLTDSTYVIRGITQWIWGWQKNGWLNGEKQEVANKDLWIVLSEEVKERKGSKIEWKYVRGHTGVAANERCDEIAVAYSTGKYVDLYSGPLLKYDVPVYDLPDDMSVPEMKSRSEKKAEAFSYLSLVNGELQRHKTWKECEARVKGRAGAKFKKAMSAADEKVIIKSWGVKEN